MNTYYRTALFAKLNYCNIMYIHVTKCNFHLILVYRADCLTFTMSEYTNNKTFFRQSTSNCSLNVFAYLDAIMWQRFR